MGNRARNELPVVPRGLDALLYKITVGDSSGVRETVNSAPRLVNAVHPSGTTPLYFAVRHQMPNITDLLLQHEAEPNPALPGRISVREMADALPDEDILNSLLAAGARKKPARLRKSEEKPIFPTIIFLKASDLPLCAALNDSAEFTRVAAAMPQKRLQTLLAGACSEREAEFGTALLPHVAKPDFLREADGNPLLNASESGCCPLVRALVESGATRHALEAFCTAAAYGHADVCAELLSAAEADKSFRKRVATLARPAAENGYTTVAELLLPFADAATSKAAKRLIAAWRDEYDGDAMPTCFGWGGDEVLDEIEEGEDDFLARLNAPQSLDDGTVRSLTRQLSDKQPIRELVSLIGLIREMAQSGIDFRKALPQLKKHQQHDNEKVARAAGRTIRVIEA